LQRKPGVARGEVAAEARPRTLSVLVVGTDDWAIEQSAAALEGAGHAVQRCHEPGSTAFPCNAVLPGQRCPLDGPLDVVVTSRARPVNEPTPTEMGAICCLHAHVPLVVTGVGGDGPFAPYAARVVEGQGHVASACVAVAAADVIELPEESA
jgi:hypothetical protein